MRGYFDAKQRTGPAIAVVCDITKSRDVFRAKALLAKDDYWHDRLTTGQTKNAIQKKGQHSWKRLENMKRIIDR